MRSGVEARVDAELRSATDVTIDSATSDGAPLSGDIHERVSHLQSGLGLVSRRVLSSEALVLDLDVVLLFVEATTSDGRTRALSGHLNGGARSS